MKNLIAMTILLSCISVSTYSQITLIHPKAIIITDDQSYIPDGDYDVPDLKKIKPERLLSFKTTLLDGKVYFLWTAKVDTGNALILIERSTDGQMWYQIGFKEISCNVKDMIILNSWIDKHPLSGVAFYRIG
ncbi:MAG: hypothetical protein IH948_05420, partial [Bacteroidetes bacterium]|nr:hypothetical protein [Bacteroidota bacterium]